MKSKKYDVFISYSRKDIDEVKNLVDFIKQKLPDITYWFDITGIESGDEFEEKIISAINNSSLVLFMISNNSMNSGWTKDEVTYAKNIGKKVVPILLNDTYIKDGWFLFKFGRIDCVDSTDPLQIEKLLNNLSLWLNKELVLTEKIEIKPNFLKKDEYYWKLNWGGLGFGIVWALNYHLYWSLLFIIPYILLRQYGMLKSWALLGFFHIFLGVYGNRLVYNKYNGSYKKFLTEQSKWNIWAYIFIFIILFLCTILILGELDISSRINVWSFRLRMNLENIF